ncbi:MAG TPA: hypothetical protein VJB35_01905 [Candidatus Nanoarchaeia archaeon]|nr:hypothetical protein [Candidatus Nanoarchaeia archaeon]
MKFNFDPYSKQFMFFGIFVFLSLVLMNELDILPSWVNVKFGFILMMTAITYFFVVKIKEIPEKKRDKSSIVYYFSHFFLLSLIIIAVNQFLKRQIIIDNLFYISVVSIAFGFLTFYANRDRVEKEIEDEKIAEDKAEEKRENEFDKKFPRLKWFDFSYKFKECFSDRRWFEWIFRILICPFVFLARLPYVFVKWMYREGWWYSFVLALILLNSFMISIDNLDLLPLQNDEFLTYNAVNYIINGDFKMIDFQYGADSSKSQLFYSRSLPFSLGVAFFVKILGGDSLNYFNLRFFSVFCWVLTLIVFYLILKIFLTKIPLLFLLFSFSLFYLNIYYSRVSRMYSLFLFIFFVLILLGLKIFSKLKEEKKFPSIKRSLLIQKEFFISNFREITLFLIIFFIGIKVHYHTFFVLIIFYFYLVFNIKKYKWLFYPLILFLIIGLFLIGFHLFIYPLIGVWYFNSRGIIYPQFLEYNYKYLAGGIGTIMLFFIPLFQLKKSPNLIKFSYIVLFSIVPLYLFLFNGIQFHEPRYMMFIYPFYLIIIVYSIYLISKLFTEKNKFKTILFLFSLFILFITPFTIFGICGNNLLVSCPISHESKIFNLDRWNYDYDEIYQKIKENLEDDTIIVGRTIHEFYLEKYSIDNDVYPLIENIDYPKDSFTEYSKEDLEKKDLIFVEYPELIYVQREESFDEIYNYLDNREDKKLIYESEDKKTLVYSISKKVS